MLMLRPIDGITPVELILEQPHESRVSGWVTTSGMEVSLQCKDIKNLCDVHHSLVKAGVSVSKLFDRPWGGQFWLEDPNGNHFMFTNESGEWEAEPTAG